jgi:hypothetical protein
MALSQILVLDLPHWRRRWKRRNRRSQCAQGLRRVRPTVGGQTGHPLKIPRADSPCLAISCAMVWIVWVSWDRHLALLLGSDHWP